MYKKFQRASCGLAALGVLIFSPSIPVHADQWSGAKSSDWNDPLNWASLWSSTLYIDTVSPNRTVADGVIVTSGQTLGVGYDANATGNLTLQNNARFSFNYMNIGESAGATGSVEIKQSQMVIAHKVGIGNRGTGSLNISGNTASVTITSTDEMGSAFGVGTYGGTGTFDVSDGAKVTAMSIMVGNRKGVGTLTVDAATITLGYDLTVDASAKGDARVSVKNGGTITLQHDFYLGASAPTTIGYVTVTGPGSRITNAGLSMIGYRGKSIALIEAGGAYEAATVWIGYETGSEAIATVTGSSAMTATDYLVIGGYGKGTLTLQGGSTMKTPALVLAAYMTNGVQSEGTLNIGGAVGNAATPPGSISVNSLEFLDGKSSINFNHTATDYIFDATITDGMYGKGQLNAIAGRTIFSHDHPNFTGQLEASTGIFQINGDMSKATASILADGRLEGTGTVGTTSNAGVIAPGSSTGIGTLTIAGNYTGLAGSAIRISSALSTDNCPTGRLIITGNATGESSVIVTNRGGLGAPTVLGVKIIDVRGASVAKFTLVADYVTADGQRAVVAGAYAYTLHHNGTGNPDDESWYLRSQMSDRDGDGEDSGGGDKDVGGGGEDGGGGSTTPPPSPQPSPVRLHPGIPLYESLPQVLTMLNSISTLQERVGNRYWSGRGDAAAASAGGDPTINGNGFWGRNEGGHGSFAAARSTSASTREVEQSKAQAGFDVALRESKDSLLVASLIANYGQAFAEVKSIYGRGAIDATGYGVGAALTWYRATGFYLDGQAHYTWFDADLKSRTTGRHEKANGGGYAVSLEAGQRIALGNGVSLTPQAQLIYANIDFDSFKDSFGTRVRLDRGESLKARLGLALDKEASWHAANGTVSRVHISAIANIYNEFLNGSRVDVAGVRFANANERLWGSVGIGGSYNWNNDQYSLYGKVSVGTSLRNFGDSNLVAGSIGLRARW